MLEMYRNLLVDRFTQSALGERGPRVYALTPKGRPKLIKQETERGRPRDYAPDAQLIRLELQCVDGDFMREMQISWTSHGGSTG